MRVAVLVSGAGTILEAIVEAGVPVVAALADRQCAALERAAGHGIATELVERTSFGKDFDRAAYTHLLVDALKRHDIDVVVIAGFGTVTSGELYDAYGGRVLNTHPSLLPAFKGWHAVRAALEAGVKVTGCTVHISTLEMDSGPILAQEAVTVRPDDDETTLHDRIKEVERRLYPETIKAFLAQLNPRS